MANCLNGGDAKFTELNTELVPTQSKADTEISLSKHDGSAAPHRSFRGIQMATFVWLALLTAGGIAAFIMAAWATRGVDQLRFPPVLLVQSPKNIPAGYLPVSLASGTGYWSAASDIKYKRSDHATVAYKGNIYIIGGLGNDPATDNASVIANTVRYYPLTGLSDELNPMPEGGRYRFGYVLVGDTVYIMGGTNNPDPDAAKAGDVTTALSYNIATGEWKTLPSAPSVPRIDLAAATLNGKVYAIAGYDADFNCLSSIEEYDPATGIWTPFPASLNTGRGDVRAATLDNTMFVVGGVNFDDPNTFLTSIEAYNSATGKWEYKANMNQARGDFALEVLPNPLTGQLDRVFVAGGERGNGTVTQLALYSTEVYVVDDDIWVEKAPLPEARFRADMANANDRVYIIGGAPNCGLNSTLAEKCFNKGLSSVYGFFDITYPKLYALMQLPRRLMRLL